MTAVDFPESNKTFGPPKGYSESQIGSIKAWIGQVEGGSCDGMPSVIVAWKPTPEEIEQIVSGAPIFVSFAGAIVPHFLSTDFVTAQNPK